MGAEHWLGLGQYDPRGAFRAFHARPQRYAAMVCHRRAGKTVACCADLVCAALFTKKQDARFAYVAPHLVQAKDIAWMYIKRLTADIPGVQYNEAELRADFPNGARIRLYGGENADRLRGIYLDGIILDEYADMRPSIWGEIVRPLLMDRQGWAVFIGTPKGRNAFYEVYNSAVIDPSWYSLKLTAEMSGFLPEEELAAARRDMTPEQFAQEIECSFDAAIQGAYYGKEIADAEAQGRICDVPYDPLLPVHTVWDIGVGDSMAIWMFQVTRGDVRVIDYMENHSKGFDYYVAELNAKPYVYGTDWVPHDAKVREPGAPGARSRLQTLVTLGRKPDLVPDQKIEDGINAARMVFPRLRFDQARCRYALEALRQYRVAFDEKTKAFKNHPKHDWTSHCADAFRYLCLAYREMVPAPPPEPVVPANVPLINTLTIDQYWQTRPETKRSTRV